ncbi:phage antirepressor N-terminal domain-containing protein [Ectopseudomonas guguanensis]|uniref:phage antirepressor N-terminal domain-containing protein n=1 Tax=Ectopseudomonas guguanensis TaxID=1198456 RepID=UPI0009E54F6F|nr:MULTISPECIES: phage antirepressor N-terminal domain-containing protein [Pseudomonas]
MTFPYLIDSAGERYWPMRPLCEAIELNWHSQAAKLHPPRYTPREHDVRLPGQSPMKRALCLPQAEFEFWLKGLSSRKVNPGARLRVDQLRTHFFGDASAEKEHPFEQTAAAPKVLNRILNWRLKQTEPSDRSDLAKQITGQFREKNGFEIAEAQEHQLRGAVASLSTIIYQHDRSKTPSHMPISQRVDTIIKSIVDARPQRIHLLDSDFAALLCSIELEGQHYSNAHHDQP